MDARLRLSILERDRTCVVQRWVPHVCADTMGFTHSSGDLSRLTIEHVKDELRMGKKAPDDPAHMVAACGYANLHLAGRKDVREKIRAYLVHRMSTGRRA